MSKNPSLFVASSQTGLDYARAISQQLSHDDVYVVLWPDLFDKEPMATNIEQLEQLKSFDFGVVVFTPDDLTVSKGKEELSPRDNLIFELGLLVAYLGRGRVFPIVPQNEHIKLPTDLLGTNPLRYKDDLDLLSKHGFAPALEVACTTIRNKISSVKGRPLVAGQTAAAHQSGIRLPDNIAFDSHKQRLKVQIGYQGPGSLLDVHFRLYLVSMRPTKNGQGHKRNWKRVRYGYSPEIAVNWDFSVKIEEKPAFTKDLKTDTPFTVADLQSLTGWIVLYVTGYDSMNMTRQHNRKLYRPKDIRDGKYRTFFFLTKDGDHESIRWEDFGIVDAHNAD